MTGIGDGFVFLDEALPGVRWDAKYATWDNFTGIPVDGYRVNRVVGSDAMAAGLADARARAQALGFDLLLWDAYRPQRAVDRFMAWAEEPDDGRTKDAFYPQISRGDMFTNGYVATRSGHSRGASVDLALYRLADGELVPMGGRHDLMDPLSHHGATGVSDEVAENRIVFCTLMEDSGFRRYPTEWWHYDLVDQPHPDTYFDFPIA